MNDYYDHDHDTKLNKVESEKLNLMALNLKDLLGRLLGKKNNFIDYNTKKLRIIHIFYFKTEKRKLAKRNMIVDVIEKQFFKSKLNILKCI